MPEVSPEHFSRVLLNVPQYEFSYRPPWIWCHLECRELPSVYEMAKAWMKHKIADARLSVEVEKPSMNPADVLPLLQLCDVVFFSREFVEKHAADVILAHDTLREVLHDSSREHVAHQFIRALRMRSNVVRGLWVVPWGVQGAFAVDDVGRGLHEPACVPDRVVDTTGAGDTFIAAVIYAILLGHTFANALRCACAIAGRKVSQVGFDGLSSAMPDDLGELIGVDRIEAATTGKGQCGEGHRA